MMIIKFLLIGMVQIKDINKNGRLYGEIAYFRRWSEARKKPDTDVNLDDESFNNLYGGDIIYVPRGVEDLYYLNNKEVGIDSANVYIIDAVNSMIYKVSGYKMKNVSVHSLAMYKELTGGNATVNFASAEVSGGGDNVKYVGEKYLKDKNGNYIDEHGNIVDEERKVINPNGFKIIASGDNIFKLYNNGDLYGKGIKGAQLNTSLEEMNKLNPYVWSRWEVPTEVKDCKKIIAVNTAIFFVDKNDDLWVCGENNADNRLGLTSEQSIDYTGRTATKINLGNKKVKNVFPGYDNTFVITTDDKLFATGSNAGYQLGLGRAGYTEKFEEVDFDFVSDIEYIYAEANPECEMTVIRCKEHKFYVAGNDSRGILNGKKKYSTFTRAFDGSVGPDIDSEIKDLSWTTQLILVKNDGTVWMSGFTGYVGGGLSNSETMGTFKKYNDLTDIEGIYTNWCNSIVLRRKKWCNILFGYKRNFSI